MFLTGQVPFDLLGERPSIQARIWAHKLWGTTPALSFCQQSTGGTAGGNGDGGDGGSGPGGQAGGGESPSGGGQAGDHQAGGASGTTAGDGGSGGGDGQKPGTFTVDGETFDPERAMRAIRTLRAENKELKPLAQKAKDLEDANKSELEKATGKVSDLEKEVETLTARLQDKTLRYEVATAAAKLNIVDPSAAAVLLLAEHQGEIKYNEAGDPTNVEALLTEMVKTKTYLVSQDGNNTERKPVRPTPTSSTSGSKDDAAKRREAIEERAKSSGVYAPM